MLGGNRQNDCSEGVAKSHARFLLNGIELNGSHGAVREQEELPRRSLKDVPVFPNQRLAQRRSGLLQAYEVVVGRAPFNAGAKCFYSIPYVPGEG